CEEHSRRSGPCTEGAGRHPARYGHAGRFREGPRRDYELCAPVWICDHTARTAHGRPCRLLGEAKIGRIGRANIAQVASALPVRVVLIDVRHQRAVVERITYTVSIELVDTALAIACATRRRRTVRDPVITYFPGERIEHAVTTHCEGTVAVARRRRARVVAL